MEVYVGFNSNEEINEFKYQQKLKKYPEIWKKVKYNGKYTHYKISNHGRLKNTKLHRIKDYSNYSKNNYYRNTIIIQNKKKIHVSIHRLVAIYFCAIPKRHKENGLSYNDLYVNHKDGNTNHNAAFNLEWVTPKENTIHAFKVIKTGIIGEKSHLSKISKNTAIKICNLIMEKKNNKEILKILQKEEPNLTLKIIQHIRSCECWKDVSKDYKFPKLNNVKPNTIPIETVIKVCELLETKKYSAPEIAKICGVNRDFVKDIKTHRRHNKISKNYNF